MEVIFGENLETNQNRSHTNRNLSPFSVNLTDQNSPISQKNYPSYSPNITADQSRPIINRNVSPFSLRKTTLLLARSKKNKYIKEGLNNKPQNFYCVNSLTRADTSDVSYITKKNTINVSNSNTPIKKRKKKVEFVANFKLVTKIYYDPNEPIVNMNKKHWDERKNKADNKLKENNKENLDSNKTLNIENNDREEEKENVLCSCLIY